MRKRNLVIGAVVALVGVLVAAGISAAAVSTETYSAVASKTKQDKKVRGPLGSFKVTVERTYTGVGVAGVTPPPTQNVLTFDRDFRFNPGNLPQCNLASLAGKDAAGARAACPKSVVGQGSAIVKTAGGTNLNAIVTAFNGVRSGGNPTIYLHVDIQGSTTKPILTGTLNGNTLTVQVPLVPGTALTHFDTTINQLVTKKTRNKTTGKVVKTFYISAKCSHRSWGTTNTTTFQDGSTKSESFSQKCKKKK
jgi:hypothetical protein